MAPPYTEAEVETIRAFVRRRKRSRERALAASLAQAQKDCAAIVGYLVSELDPLRVYQWGSLVHTGHFSELSDIDIAVEGAPDPARLFELTGKAQAMTAFVLDIVRLEGMHPAYADHIRRRGRLVHERQA